MRPSGRKHLLHTQGYHVWKKERGRLFERKGGQHTERGICQTELNEMPRWRRLVFMFMAHVVLNRLFMQKNVGCLRKRNPSPLRGNNSLAFCFCHITERGSCPKCTKHRSPGFPKRRNCSTFTKRNG